MFILESIDYGPFTTAAALKPLIISVNYFPIDLKKPTNLIQDSINNVHCSSLACKGKLKYKETASSTSFLIRAKSSTLLNIDPILKLN